MIVANEATVKGALIPDDGENHLRAQESRRKTGCLAFIWSIPAAPICQLREVFPDRDHFGAFSIIRPCCPPKASRRSPWSWAHAARRALMFRRCATRRSLCAGRGQFSGAPPLVAAATGEVVTAEELGGADVHARSGVAIHSAETTRTRLADARIGREYRATTPSFHRGAKSAPPRYDTTNCWPIPADSHKPSILER